MVSMVWLLMQTRRVAVQLLDGWFAASALELLKLLGRGCLSNELVMAVSAELGLPKYMVNNSLFIYSEFTGFSQFLLGHVR